MKLALIAVGLLATTGVVYAACLFCWSQDRMREKARSQMPGFFFWPPLALGCSRIISPRRRSALGS